MVDPLSPGASASARLMVAGAAVLLVWLAVAWALA
jgi:hypothetical protein